MRNVERQGVIPLVFLLASAGCLAAPARYVAPDFSSAAPAKVAVLPFDNRSVDLVGPEMLRKMVASRLKLQGYDALPLDWVDDGLRGLGITDGGQLPASTPGKIGAAMGASGLLYGVVEEFTMQNLGFVIRRCVRLHLRLVQAATGATLWEDTGSGFSGSITVKKKEAGKAFLEGLAQRVIENAFRTPLLPESTAAVDELFSRLPKK